MEYLSNFVKEVLRFTPPAARSLGYKTLQQTTMSDGVMIPKG
jgi:cytochrome P450